MKKILFLLMAVLIVVGCSSENEEERLPQAVKVTLDYTFWESGSMTRSGKDVYKSFYDNYIKTKVLTPKNYSLTLKNTATGEISEIKGHWDKKEGIKLMEGTYELTGTSSPLYTSTTTRKVDTLFLAFKENIIINQTTTTVNLSAKHDSYMLILDADNTKSINYNFGTLDGDVNKTIKLSKVDNVYFMFVSSLSEGKLDRLTITRNTGSVSTVNLSNTPFEKGKYYYFNDITNSFDVPPMDEGN